MINCSCCHVVILPGLNWSRITLSTLSGSRLMRQTERMVGRSDFQPHWSCNTNTTGRPRPQSTIALTHLQLLDCLLETPCPILPRGPMTSLQGTRDRDMMESTQSNRRFIPTLLALACRGKLVGGTNHWTNRPDLLPPGSVRNIDVDDCGPHHLSSVV